MTVTEWLADEAIGAQRMLDEIIELEVSEKFEKLVRTPKLLRQFHGVSTKRHETARLSNEFITYWTAPNSAKKQHFFGFKPEKMQDLGLSNKL
jgi:hypothetical protein